MARSLSRFQGSLVILACGVMFSFGPLTFRALQEADTWQYLFFRNVSAAGVSALIILLARRNLWRAVVAAGRQQWLAGFLMAAMFTLYVVALSRVTAAFVLLMQCASPFYAALFARIFLKEPVGRPTLVAMVVSAVGVTVMVGGNLAAGDGLGIALSVGLSVALGAYSVLIRSSPAQDPGVPTLIGGSVAAIIALVVTGAGPGVVVPASDMLMGFVGGGLLIGLATPFWNYAHRFVPPADVSLLLISEIVAAPLWLWLWMNETPSSSTLAGGAISLGAVLWLTASTARGGRQDFPPVSRRRRGLHVGVAPLFRRTKNGS